MMELTVKLFATLREGRGKILTMKKEPPWDVEKIIQELKIDKSEVAILLINGRDGTLTQPLKDGDTISIFPPVGGG